MEPKSEWVYDIKKKSLQPLPKLPRTRTNFGIATDSGKIIVVGGQTYLNEPLRSCAIFDMHDNDWHEIAPLPAPTSGPGICFLDDKIHIVGGYDIIGGQADVIGEYLVYDMNEKRWEKKPNINPKRARPLLVVPDEDRIEPGLYSVGGVFIDSREMKARPVPEIRRFDEHAGKWQLISTIPKLGPKNGLGYADGMVMVSERIIEPNTKHVISTKTTYTYDLASHTWHDGEYKRPKARTFDMPLLSSPRQSDASQSTNDSLETTRTPTSPTDDSDKFVETSHTKTKRKKKHRHHRKKTSESSATCCTSSGKSRRNKKHKTRRKHKHHRAEHRNTKKNRDIVSGRSQSADITDAQPQRMQETLTSSNFFRGFKNHASVKCVDSSWMTHSSTSRSTDSIEDDSFHNELLRAPVRKWKSKK